MNYTTKAAEPLQREIGGVNYIVDRKSKENTTEDAATKMARLIHNEALRLMGDKQFTVSNKTTKKTTQIG